MSQFPVVSQEGVLEAVNYLASGPAGLGQNFDGFSAYQPAYLTGTYRQPFSVSTSTSAPPNWFVAPISISNIIYKDDGITNAQSLEWVFATPQAVPPFQNGWTLTGAGWDPASNYNGDDGTVVSCSTTSVTTQFSKAYAWDPVVTYGTLEFEAYLNGAKTKSIPVSTDANARVTVTGPTERVFVSSQLALTSGYTCSTTSTFSVSVQINRYSGEINTDPAKNDYLFNFDATVSEQSQTYSVGPGSGTVNTGQNIFTTVIDQPSFGYYWYIAEVVWTPLTGDAVAKLQTVGLRSLTAQVIKQ
jgi:hypothetical protein